MNSSLVNTDSSSLSNSELFITHLGVRSCEISHIHVHWFYDYVDLVLINMLLAFQWYSFSIISKRHCLTAGFLVFWLLKLSLPLFHHGFWTLSVGVLLQMYQYTLYGQFLSALSPVVNLCHEAARRSFFDKECGFKLLTVTQNPSNPIKNEWQRGSQ